MLGPELKKPLKRLAARFFQLSLPAVGREQLEAVGGSCPGMLVSPRNSDMFFRRRPGAWSGRVGQGQPGSLWPPEPHPRVGFLDLQPARDVGGSLLPSLGGHPS